jgi:toxin ParE1/3/4
MKKYKVEILDEVLNEIESIVDYIALDSVQNALAWYEKIKECIFSLDEFPERCPLADENPHFPFEVRCLLVDEYRVLYRIVDDRVQTLHVKHPRMNR